MRDGLTTNGDAAGMSGGRLALALLSMAFGYALLSVCLFRMLSFTLSSTAFFVLYVAAAMPVGASLARRDPGSAQALRLSIKALLVLSICLPLIGWLATRGQAMTSTSNPFVQSGVDLGVFWRQLLFQLFAVSPLFIAWGYAEFIGYQAALRSGTRALRAGFYLIFVWALACAVAVGFWSIPRWGLMRTLALAPIAAVVAYDLLRAGTASRRARLMPFAAAIALLAGAATLEQPFVRLLWVDTPYNVGDLVRNRRLPWDATPGDTTLLESAWGAYTHLSLISYRSQRESLVLGAYDGVVYWHVSTNGDNAYTQLNAAVFDWLPEQADVAILGAGGGRQVADALNRQPKRVVAVDLVPELFTLLKGKYAWANNYVYRSPLVETVGADGRQYLENSTTQFDLIVLPHTESAVANLRSLFEVGSRLHSVEAFRLMRTRLTPHGVIATMKAVDVDGRLFYSYAATMRQAGLHVVGWTLPVQGFQTFVLVGALDRETLIRDQRTHDYFTKQGFRYVDFAETPSTSAPLYDESPWILGVLGSMMAPDQVQQMIFGVALIAAIALVAVTAVSLRSRERGETIPRRLMFVLASVSVGVHAVYLQNAVIFWLLVNLFNPLAAFFAGTALFLAAWGLSSMMLNRWYLLLGIGAAGIGGMLLTQSWQGYGAMVSLVAIAVGSGLCFPLLGLTFQTRLLNLFVADAIGGFAAGVLGIWLPVLLGFRWFFDVLPWVSLATLVLVAVTVAICEPRAVTPPAAEPALT